MDERKHGGTAKMFVPLDEATLRAAGHNDSELCDLMLGGESEEIGWRVADPDGFYNFSFIFWRYRFLGCPPTSGYQTGVMIWDHDEGEYPGVHPPTRELSIHFRDVEDARRIAIALSKYLTDDED